MDLLTRRVCLLLHQTGTQYSTVEWIKIRNNKLDQLQVMSAKMAAKAIRTHARTNK